MCTRCDATVAWDTTSSDAICWFDPPAATRVNTSVSRVLKATHGKTARLADGDAVQPDVRAVASTR